MIENRGTYLLFESKHVYIDEVQSTDVQDVVSLYNSNKEFIQHHMGTDHVTPVWVQNEWAWMWFDYVNWAGCNWLRGILYLLY